MKKAWLIGLLLALSTSTMASRLSAIDSLMWKQPDSALVALMAFAASPEADSLDEPDGHLFQLLVSELLFKNDYGQSNRRELMDAVNYFDDHGNPFLSARAHYMNGVGYFEADSVVPACEEYLTALEIMEDSFKEKELKGHKAQFMSLIYNRLGELFSNQYMMRPSIDCLEKALFFCKIEPTSPKGVANIIFQTGKQYDMLREHEKANAYYDLALRLVPDNESSLRRTIIRGKALCDYNLGKGIDLFLSVTRPILASAETEEEQMIDLLRIGGVFSEERMYDSAMVYLEPVYEKGNDLEAKIIAAEYLRVIYDHLGEKEKKDECVLFLAERKKMGGDDKALVSQVEDTFKGYLNRKQERQLAKERQKAVRKTSLIVVVAVLAVASVVVAIARRVHRAQRSALSGRLKQSNRKLRELEDRIERQETSAKAEPVASFTEEPVCRLIMERVNDGQFKSNVGYSQYAGYALDKQQLLALRLAADRHYGQFTYRLKQAYPDMTKSDVDYCCLYLLGLTDADVAALMQRAYNTVVERKGKLRRILGVENDLSTALRGLADGFLSD